MLEAAASAARVPGNKHIRDAYRRKTEGGVQGMIKENQLSQAKAEN